MSTLFVCLNLRTRSPHSLAVAFLALNIHCGFSPFLVSLLFFFCFCFFTFHAISFTVSYTILLIHVPAFLLLALAHSVAA
eukprot:m.11136 g.11136  ORF g.11136 m.11136 type:complete len:80 (-) comp5671_c0_seq1:60-299(-)